MRPSYRVVAVKIAAIAHVVLPINDSAWRDSNTGLPPGSRVAVISGDPQRAGPFTIRVELPPGYVLPPYRRAKDESIVVLAGTLDVGRGTTFDAAATRSYGPGSFIGLRGDEPHFAVTKEGATLQICGTGPFAIKYVAVTR